MATVNYGFLWILPSICKETSGLVTRTTIVSRNLIVPAIISSSLEPMGLVKVSLIRRSELPSTQAHPVERVQAATNEDRGRPLGFESKPERAYLCATVIRTFIKPPVRVSLSILCISG